MAKHWRDVIASTPQLWAFVSDIMSITEVEWVLRKSKNAPLHVLCTQYRTCSNFATAVSAHASRWISLGVSRRNLDTFASYIGCQARLLEEIRILGDDTSPPRSDPLELCEGVSLQHLDISGIALPWESCRLAGLRTLRLSTLPPEHAPSLSQLMTILEASPALKRLELRCSSVSEGTEPTGSHTLSGPVVGLPSLVDLHLSGIHSYTCQAILSRLQFPSCQKLEVDPTHWIEPPEVVSSIAYDAPNIVEAARSSVRGDSRVTVDFDSDEARLSTQGWHAFDHKPSSSGLNLLWSLQEEEKDLERVTEEVVRLVQLTCPEHRVDLCLSSNTLQSFNVKILGRLRHLERIDVGGDLGEKVLRFLSRPYADAEGEEEGWPCPNLRFLDLQRLSKSGIGAIRKWVSARWMKQKDVDGTPSEGSVEVNTLHKGGAIEKWQPALKGRKRR